MIRSNVIAGFLLPMAPAFPNIVHAAEGSLHLQFEGGLGFQQRRPFNQ
jgi:hypothetical protein